MFSYLWPVVLVVFANVMYQICAKSLPGDIDPFASLTVTYLMAAAASGILFFTVNRGSLNLLQEYHKLNWVPFVFGLVLIGLETGFIFAYKAGWQVSTLSVVQNAFLAACLIGVGFLLYQEAVTWNKVVGIVVCLVGLGIINYK